LINKDSYIFRVCGIGRVVSASALGAGAEGERQPITATKKSRDFKIR